MFVNILLINKAVMSDEFGFHCLKLLRDQGYQLVVVLFYES